MTDAPDTDDPDAADYDADDAPMLMKTIMDWNNPKIPIIMEDNKSIYQKRPQHQKTHKNITDAPNYDAKISADDDATDAPNNADDDAVSTNSK